MKLFQSLKAGVFSLLFLVLVLLVSACGGSSTTPTPSAGISGSGNGDPVEQDEILPPPPETITTISEGPIQTIGEDQLRVNNIDFNTSKALFSVDDQDGAIGDLAVGQYVVVKGDIVPGESEATANNVDFDTNVLGPVEEIDLVNQRLVIMGQTAFIESDTLYGNLETITDLVVGNIVSVSGGVNSFGGINATYIEFVSANIGDPGIAERLEVTGHLTGLDEAGQTFEVNALTIDYSAADVGTVLANNIYVEVAASGLGAGGELLATRVVQITEETGEFGSMIRIDGTITDFTSLTEFDVNGVASTTDGNTQIVGGQAADLLVDARVEIQGIVDAENQLLAENLFIKDVGDVRIQGASDGGLQIVGNNIIYNSGLVTIQVSDSTYFADESVIQREPFSIADINSGDYLQVWGFQSSQDPVIINATRVIRGDYISRRILRGVVDSSAVNNTPTNPEFFLFGIRLFSFVAVEYLDELGNAITVDDMKAALIERDRRVEMTTVDNVIEGDIGYRILQLLED